MPEGCRGHSHQRTGRTTDTGISRLSLYRDSGTDIRCLGPIEAVTAALDTCLQPFQNLSEKYISTLFESLVSCVSYMQPNLIICDRQEATSFIHSRNSEVRAQYHYLYFTNEKTQAQRDYLSKVTQLVRGIAHHVRIMEKSRKGWLHGSQSKGTSKGTQTSKLILTQNMSALFHILSMGILV